MVPTIVRHPSDLRPLCARGAGFATSYLNISTPRHQPQQPPQARWRPRALHLSARETQLQESVTRCSTTSDAVASSRHQQAPAEIASDMLKFKRAASAEPARQARRPSGRRSSSRAGLSCTSAALPKKLALERFSRSSRGLYASVLAGTVKAAKKLARKRIGGLDILERSREHRSCNRATLPRLGIQGSSRN